MNNYKNIYYIAPFARGVNTAVEDPPLTVASPLASYIARPRCCSCCCYYYDYCHRRRVLYTILLYYIYDIYRREKTGHAQFSIRPQWQRWRHKNKRATARRFDFSSRIIASDTILLPIIKKKKCIRKKETSKNTLFFFFFYGLKVRESAAVMLNIFAVSFSFYYLIFSSSAYT